MSHTLIVLIGIAYVWIAAEQWAKGNTGVWVMFLGYAIAQAGVYLQAK